MGVPNYTGYWTGTISGTNQGGFTLDISQRGDQISGLATLSEPALGEYEYAVDGMVGDVLTAQLTPSGKLPSFRLGVVQVTCSVNREGVLTGKWKSEIGTEGILTGRRFEDKPLKSRQAAGEQSYQFTTDKRNIAVFIASPGDLAAERQQFRDAIRQLNAGFGDGANVFFEALGWEDTLATTGRRNQSIINSEIDRCQIFILVMHRRWGQEAPDAAPYSSYTEEEFHRALERWRREKSPEIFVFFKRVDAQQEADAGPQLQKVLQFRQHLEDTRQVFYRFVDDGASFFNEVDKHLRAYVRGELSCSDMSNPIVLPLLALEEVKKSKEEVLRQARLAETANQKAEAAYLKLEELQLESAQEAAEQASQGNIERARERFGRLAADTSNIQVLYLAYEFFQRTGDLGAAQVSLERWLAISGPDAVSIETAAAYGNLGTLHLSKSEFDLAKTMYEKSQVISESVGYEAGVANAYAHLGNIHEQQGNYTSAETMYEQALALEERLGRKEQMAKNYGHLGVLYMNRGELSKAKMMYERALATNEELEQLVGMAENFVDIGILYKNWGELDKAEEMYLKGLAINEKLGVKVAIASCYSNLGSLYKIQGDIDRSEEITLKAAALYGELGNAMGMADAYGNLGIIYKIKGDLGHAQVMQEKALVINKELGRKGAVAHGLSAMGNIYKALGNLERAEAMYMQAIAIDEELGRKASTAIHYGNLATIYMGTGDLVNAYIGEGDLDKAEMLLQKARSINEGLNQMDPLENNYVNLEIVYRERGDSERATEMHAKASAIRNALRPAQVGDGLV
jgi:tetratricopeptide (TPR) repeat protein